MATNFQETPLTMKNRSELDRNLDWSFIWLTRIFALAITGILLWIALQITIAAWPAIQKFGINFLFTSNWNPVNNEYGVLPAIYGTLMSSLIGLILAIPIGVGTAILLSEDLLPSKVQLVLVFLVELLAAIPSVVYGVWGIFVLVPILTDLGKWLHGSLGWLPIFSSAPTGPGMLPAGVILAIMTLPIITAISRDALISLPSSLRQAALAVGATRWETIFQVIIPAAFSGIASAVMLALGRAMGETMAVTMLIGNANNINISLLAPSNTISSLLASQFAEANGLQVAALMYAALVLFVLTMIVNILAEFIVARVQ
ncbi:MULTISPECIES: phosphate ABC transporter permease subunit PstC [Aphanizomenon]|jgi:phosphate transport system permease protein|uniref:Phosphate transport system permease protein n=1 Tax=Aphanizomenon flos-aquae FACHB-1249 TaxID=2692889 RepID=A0ABR8INK8_APHFL|nr:MULTISPECIES: phosphate ABC transporter permease subunit PstC [Aphanizomenon]MBD2630534.1 phosphate ABC transporter permease subunit PstC [Aphanizomenon sp. FACHB-1399]MBD2641850.1 phosphate ABC transporter permease subunit PstC [Aphanizomenon sp. FACHB-1401]MBD2675393.1 phosphate ABC transporter permease subunit PstC [Aphanizomenon flos-aquae FACHB-1416]MBD2684872.1 phosphate ABC transporter permease subunit PstC [Aphanizomenon flos-aquae FACHB-1249]